MRYTVSQRLTHFFHVLSEIKPVTWIGIYVVMTPIFALIYWGLPEGQFRMPADAPTDYGAWLYYSIVTITTLGFGDYTPAHGAAQCVTAIEVICGLIFFGLFLNAVAAVKSEVDVESELEKQKRLHFEIELEKLRQSMPIVIHSVNVFVDNCENKSSIPKNRLIKSASHTSLVLDSIQQRIDLTLWPRLLEDCFAFVANYQLYANNELGSDKSSHQEIEDGIREQEAFINMNKALALNIEKELSIVVGEPAITSK